VACEFRLTMESIDLMAPYCTKRKFKLTFQDLVDLLKEVCAGDIPGGGCGGRWCNCAMVNVKSWMQEQVDGPRLSHGAQVVMRDWSMWTVTLGLCLLCHG
jgi:hypothetical protein